MRSNQKYLSRRGAQDGRSFSFTASIHSLLSQCLMQDLATQVFYWDHYISECKAAGLPRAKYLNPHVGEFLSGCLPALLACVPSGWCEFQLQASQDSPKDGRCHGPVLRRRTSMHCFQKEEAVPVPQTLSDSEFKSNVF